jgi:predicted Zn-dependent protease
LLVAGCTVYGPSAPVEDRSGAPPPPPPPVAATERAPVAPAPVPTPQPAPLPERAPEPPRHDPATLALLQQSERAAGAGNYDEAIAYVERALRINGQDVELWLRLAELQLGAARPANAEQLAQRAIAMAGSRVDWQRRGWLIVADARDALGDHEEAERIRFQWRSYRG